MLGPFYAFFTARPEYIAFLGKKKARSGRLNNQFLSSSV
jgi:hypothetical protein